MGPGSIGAGSRALAWLLSSEGSVGSAGSVGGVLQPLGGAPRWIASTFDKDGFLRIHYRFILIGFLGVLFKMV